MEEQIIPILFKKKKKTEKIGDKNHVNKRKQNFESLLPCMLLK